MLKSTISALFLALAAAAANGQITLTSDDMPKPGTTVWVQIADSAWAAKAVLGSTGANQTWDFSGAKPDALFGPAATYYQLPSETLFADDFPEASLASRYDLSDSSEISYLKSTSSTFGLIGQEGPGSKTTLGAPLVRFKFPYTYDSKALTNTTIAIESDGTLPVNGGINFESQADAWGTVVTPLGTFPCLRVKAVSTVNISFLGFPLTITSTDYEWWTSEHPAPVFSHNTTDTDFFGQVETSVGATYLTATSVGTDSRPDAAASLSVAPNPTSSATQLTIETERSATGAIFLYDASGKLVREIRDVPFVAGKTAHALDLSDLAPGNYMALVMANGKSLGVKQVVKQ